jgi:hypothetical protein
MANENVRRGGVSGSLTPFPDDGAGETASTPEATGSSYRETPFLSEYSEAEGEGEGEQADPLGEKLDELLEGLHEPELDEAVEALVDELRGQVAAEPAFETEHEDVREAMLRETVAPLLEAAQADIARLSEALSALDLANASEQEIQEVIHGTPLPEMASPAFEFFLSGLRKKLGKVVQLAKNLSPLHLLLKPLMAKVASLAQPIVDKVVAFALDKVPEPYKPMVAALAARLRGKAQAAASGLLGGAPAPASEEEATAETYTGTPVPQELATPDTRQAQHEMDLGLAEALLSGGGADQEVIEAGAGRQQRVVARDPYADLAQARERFVREITQAEGEEETQVVVEHFLPAVMFALRQGIRLAGRNNVLGWVSKPIAAIIAPLVGKANAPVLAKVLADVGMRTFLQAEVDAGTEMEAAGQAIASTVEDTVRRVAQLPEALLEQPEALASYVHEAFEGAAAANFPASLVRPELRETERHGAWVLLPRRGRRRIKKFCPSVEVRITPAVARAVRGYGTSTLAGLFRDRLRLPPAATVTARVHMYEAVPGTSLAAISRTEEARGLGSSDPEVSSQIQPLTPQAALLLLDSPGMGRELPEDATQGVPRVGQRLYYLEVAGAPPRPLGRESSIHVGVHPRLGEIRLALYLSEVVAQKIATALRAKKPAAAVVTELRSLLAPAAEAISQSPSHNTVRIHGLRRHGAALGRGGVVGRAARHALRRQIAGLALHWAWRHLATSFDGIGADFIAKADAPEDGVRLVFTFHVPNGLTGLCRLFRGQAQNVPDWPPSAPSRTGLVLHAGPRHA